jgi:hypothetical protein
VEELNRRYLAGEKIDIEPLVAAEVCSCHVALPYTFEAIAAYQEHFACWGIEKENTPDRPYFDIAVKRISAKLKRNQLFD